MGPRRVSYCLPSRNKLFRAARQLGVCRSLHSPPPSSMIDMHSQNLDHISIPASQPNPPPYKKNTITQLCRPSRAPTSASTPIEKNRTYRGKNKIKIKHPPNTSPSVSSPSVVHPSSIPESSHYETTEPSASPRSTPPEPASAPAQPS